MTRIEIVTPAKARTRSGNRATALRWRKRLEELGINARVTTAWSGGSWADALIALHSFRSAESILRFRDAHPGRACLVALTGTDLYRDLANEPLALEAAGSASVLIALHDRAEDDLPRQLRPKVAVVHQSATAPRRHPSRRHFPRFCVVGHLRDVKDPLRPVDAIALLPDLPLRLVQAGAVLERKWEARVSAAMKNDPRYRWIGEVTPGEARSLIARSDAMILPSLMEGGANVISEAVVAGTPVLASRIASSIGLLGDDYVGFFEAGDSDDLARLIRRFVDDERFRERLRRQGAARARRFTPENERRELAAALRRAGVSLPGRRTR